MRRKRIILIIIVINLFTTPIKVRGASSYGTLSAGDEWTLKYFPDVNDTTTFNFYSFKIIKVDGGLEAEMSGTNQGASITQFVYYQGKIDSFCPCTSVINKIYAGVKLNVTTFTSNEVTTTVANDSGILVEMHYRDSYWILFSWDYRWSLGDEEILIISMIVIFSLVGIGFFFLIRRKQRIIKLRYQVKK